MLGVSEEPAAPFRRPKFEVSEPSPGSEQSEIRCLPDLVSFNAAHNPHQLFCMQAQPSEDGSDVSPTLITFAEFAQAVEDCCCWIRKSVPGIKTLILGDNGALQKGPPVALFLESDIGLFIYLVALLSLNVPCLLLSIRLSTVAVRHLLQESSAASILVSARTRKVAEEAVSGLEETGVPLCVLNAAPYVDLLELQETRDWSSNTVYKSETHVCEDDQNVLILHSSGTTGLPKPIRLAHRYLLGYAACHCFPEGEVVNGLNVSTLPLYHGFGLLAPCLALSLGMPFCLPPTSTIPTGRQAISLITQLKASSLMTVPLILEDIVENGNPCCTELSDLDFVAVGGGAMKPSIGKALHSSGVKILNHYGATEIGALAPIFRPDQHYDWTFLRLRTDIGLKLVHPTLGADGDCPTEVSRRCKLIGYPFGWGRAFELQDELECNPLHPDSEVRILGRNDDLIVLATGEKVLPRLLEDSLSRSPLIRTAIAFGDGQFELGLIIEPADAEAAHNKHEFLESVWPLVLAGNELMDDHGTVSSKTAVIVKPEDKPIPRSDKGSPMRKEIYALFSSEIDAVYKELNDGRTSEMSMRLDVHHLEETLQEMVQFCFHNKVAPGTWSTADDFFQLGMDSLQATRFRRVLLASRANVKDERLTSVEIPSDFVYLHPSVSKIAAALRHSVSSSVCDASKRASSMEALVRRYSFHDGQKTLSAGTSPKTVVLLTGTTGSLGAHLLEHLCKDPAVHRIICLVRPARRANRQSDTLGSTYSHLRARQKEANAVRGIALPETAWSKVAFRPWDTNSKFLGVGRQEYLHLSLTVTHICHCAWPMDFKQKLQSFEGQVRAVKKLAELAIAGHHARPQVIPRLVLISSIAVVGQYPMVMRETTVPELAMDDSSVTVPIGYAEGKWVCEKILESAASSHPNEIQPIIVSVGQISGSESTGYWNKDEHIPALVKASQAIGHFPDLRGDVSWLPVDRCARALSDIVIGPGSRDFCYHLENPVRQPWSNICAVMMHKLGLPKENLIPFGEWLDRFPTDENGAMGLAEFFKVHFERMSQGDLILATKRSREVSSELRLTGGVASELVELYLDSWQRAGFLAPTIDVN